jgi:adenylate cyclase
MPRYAAFALIAALGAALAAFGITERYDLKILDGQFRLLRAASPQPVARDVAIVGIDEATAKLFPEPITLWHAHLGRFLSAMALAKPAVVGLDIILPDRSYDSVLPGSDKKLLKGVLDARRVTPLVLGQTVEPSGSPRQIHPLFLRIAGGSGYALFPLDGDGVVRRFDERLADGGQSVPTLAGEMARKIGVEAGGGYINYRQGGLFQYVPLQRVLQWEAAGDAESLARAFGGRPVLIGIVLPFEDRQSVPAQLAAWDDPSAARTAGVLVHAQALRSMLNGGFLKEVPVAVTIAASVALAALWFVSVGTVTMLLALLGLAALLAASSTLLLVQGWIFPFVTPALTAAVALGGRHGLDTLIKLRERRRLRASFGGYVSPSVMDEILAGRIQPDLGGENQFVCILFSDIRGYTTRSEGMTPQQVIQFLNRYFDRTVALIHEHGGAVVSFMGDGIMAVFGAPKPLGNPCREAFEASRAMLAYVAELNGQFRAEGVTPIEIGIGLHAGEAVIGHVGSSTRHDYTAIGDVTNVASRLESLTKEAGYRVVVSRVVAEALGEDAPLTALGPMAIKGHTPVEVYGHDKI